MRKIISIVLVLCLCVAFTACTAPSKESASSGDQSASAGESQPAVESGDTYKIGFGLWFRQDQWWKDLEAEALKTAAEQGVELLVQDGDGDSAKQVQQFETWLAQGVDAIIYAPVDASATTALVAQAAEKDIPVVCLETSLEDMSNVTSYFMFDQVQVGYDAGVMAGEWLQENYDGQGKFIGIYDTTNVTVQIPRWEGFKEGLYSVCPDAELVGEHDGKNDRSEAMSITDNVLSANEDIRIWHAGMSDMAYGIVGSMEARGLNSDEYYVCTEGWGQETVDCLLADSNYLKLAFASLGTDAARAAVEAVAAYLKGGVAIPEEFLVGMPLITAENVAQYAAGIGATIE